MVLLIEQEVFVVMVVLWRSNSSLKLVLFTIQNERKKQAMHYINTDIVTHLMEISLSTILESSAYIYLYLSFCSSEDFLSFSSCS